MAVKAAGRPGLTLGPVLFNWPAERWRDFYFAVADEGPYETVYVGEVVCAKRAPFFAPVLPAVIERLGRARKEVVLSTPILIGGPREMREAEAEAADAELMLEANDIGMAALLAGRPHCIGPAVNAFNERTLAFLAKRGAVRCTLPWEASGAMIERLVGSVPGVAIEVAAFGRMPLAISARCYHARAHGVRKDSCRYVCADDADGMAVDTLDGEPFLAVNGTQTLSFRYLNLLTELPALRAMGVDYVRLSPHSFDMIAIGRLFRAVLDGRMEAEEALTRLAALTPGASFANGFFRGAAGVEALGALAAAE